MGFKEGLKNYSCETIASIFDEINEDYNITFNKTGKLIVDKKDLHIKVMSDSVCIYIETKIENSLTALIATCDYLQIRLLRLPIPVLSRGAIVEGEIYHENDVLFGQGFVDAFYKQEYAAVFPRIIIDDKVIENYKCKEEIGQKYIDDMIIRDCCDNRYISDYLYLFYGLNHSQDSWKNFAKYVYDKVENEKSERIKSKYIYLKSKFEKIGERYMKYLEQNE